MEGVKTFFSFGFRFFLTSNLSIEKGMAGDFGWTQSQSSCHDVAYSGALARERESPGQRFEGSL